jgi:hypothetical protein
MLELVSNVHHRFVPTSENLGREYVEFMQIHPARDETDVTLLVVSEASRIQARDGMSWYKSI